MDNLFQSGQAPDTIQELLVEQNNHLKCLREAVDRVSEGLPCEIKGHISDQLRLLEETERQMWAAMAHEPEHRMTMVRSFYTEQFY